MHAEAVLITGGVSGMSLLVSYPGLGPVDGLPKNGDGVQRQFVRLWLALVTSDYFRGNRDDIGGRLTVLKICYAVRCQQSALVRLLVRLLRRQSWWGAYTNSCSPD